MPSLDLPPRSVERVVLESSFWTVMAIAGFLGNSLVCIAFLRNPFLRKLTSVYIIALAITDILNFLTNGIFVAVTLITGGWQFGATGCVISSFSSIFLIYASISTMSLAAFNRFIRVTRPGVLRSIFVPIPSIVILTSMWFIEITIVLLPFVIGDTKFIFHAGYAICVPSYEDNFKNFTTITHVSVITASLLIVPACYYKVNRALKRVHVPESQAPQQPQQLHVMQTAEEARSALQQDEQANHQPEAAIRLKKEPKNGSQPVETCIIPQQQEPASFYKIARPLKQASPQKTKERKQQGTQRPQEIVRYNRGKDFNKVQPAESEDNSQSGELQVTQPQKFASYKRHGAFIQSHKLQATYEQQGLKQRQELRIPQTPVSGTSAVHRTKSDRCKRNETLINVQPQTPGHDTCQPPVPKSTHQTQEKQEAHQEVAYQQEQQATQQVNEPGVGQNNEVVLKAKEVKITKMMFAIVLAFTLIWIPLFFIIILARITLGTLPRDVMMLAVYGSSFSSLINPVLYAIMNRSYRKEYKLILQSILRYFSKCFERCEISM